MSACGQIEQPMSVEGQTVTLKVHVLPKLREPLILGIEFIQEHALQYCPTHCQFHWSEQCPVDHASVLTLKVETENSDTTVVCKNMNGESGRHSGCRCLWHCQCSGQGPTLDTGRTCLDKDANQWRGLG